MLWDGRVGCVAPWFVLELCIIQGRVTNMGMDILVDIFEIIFHSFKTI